jgi:protein-S-isoprenylcysteine O-methyltransferase Ste14
MNTPGNQSHSPEPSLDRWGKKRIIEIVLTTLLYGVILFGAAGRLDWLRAWSALGIWSAGLLGMGLVIARKNPQLFNERGKKHAMTRGFDKVFFAIYIPMGALSLALAGLDAGRFGWSSMPAVLSLVGGLLHIPFFLITAWAMAENRYFEQSARIQHERGHQVCSSGPYQYVRHPGYAAAILMNLSAPLLLGSWWSFIPRGIIVVAFVVRTNLEDRMLCKDLPGYAEYARHTRYRLLPGVW